MGLNARALGYTYGAGTSFAATALEGVDLDLEPGELVLVAGTTGSGKSTLLKLLAGLLAPTAGTIEVDGAAPSARDARGRVAIVFQNPETQFFAETVLADVAFGPRNMGAGDPDRRALAAIEAVGLDPERFADRSPFALSGGEARRVAVAGALAMGARYLLLDEPTAGLDADGRRGVHEAIDAERIRAGIVVVTHDPEEFLGRADRLLVLRDGACAYEGPPSRLLDDAGRFEATGLRLPDIVRVQVLARRRGARIATPAFDPSGAATLLRDAREAAR